MDIETTSRITCIVINGSACAGKDTFIESLVANKYLKSRSNVCIGKAAHGEYIYNLSSVDRIKAAAGILGWNPRFKSEADRRFLHELKECSIRYNDGPTKYVLEFLKWLDKTHTDCYSYVFVHIREPEEINKLKLHVLRELKHIKFRTLLVRDTSSNSTYENGADNVVEDYDYDCVFSYNKQNDLFENTVTRFQDAVRGL